MQKQPAKYNTLLQNFTIFHLIKIITNTCVIININILQKMIIISCSAPALTHANDASVYISSNSSSQCQCCVGVIELFNNFYKFSHSSLLKLLHNKVLNYSRFVQTKLTKYSRVRLFVVSRNFSLLYRITDGCTKLSW